MILALMAVLQIGAPAPARDTASMPRVTLTEALERATRFDPSYVSALGQVDNAEWGRRAAFLAFILPSLSASADYTVSSSPSFNFGTNQLARTIVTARLDARYELFAGGRKFFDLSRARAELEGAEAGELRARLLSALATEQAFYSVLTNVELLAVERARVERARDQLEVSRARVVSGAAVQSDSLQLALELTRALTDELRQETNLRVSRLDLGRLIGLTGPADAIPLDVADAPDLPITLSDA
ncbi:MAG: TolC family protein [Gemmatimonadales bacterium]